MAILKVQELRKSYKKGFIPKSHLVLKGLSFSLPERTVTGFLGGNGAGKTTTIKCLLGLAFPDAGDIRFFGDQLLSNDVKRRIGFLPERPYFYEYLTGLEFLRFYAELSTQFSKPIFLDRAHRLLKRVDLYHAKDKRLRDYSKGMLQKIGVAQALIHDPELVILDEPMSGLDPDGRYYLSEIIRETANDGKCVFFSSHVLGDTEALCDRLVVLTDGKLSYEGGTHEYLAKMGEGSIVHYLKNGQLTKETVANEKELQIKLQQLLQQGAVIQEVKHDRNLEQAFIRMGLRKETDETNLDNR
jgi:ABC-2 type transport system ATP-binding protein